MTITYQILWPLVIKTPGIIIGASKVLQNRTYLPENNTQIFFSKLEAVSFNIQNVEYDPEAEEGVVYLSADIYMDGENSELDPDPYQLFCKDIKALMENYHWEIITNENIPSTWHKKPRFVN